MAAEATLGLEQSLSALPRRKLPEKPRVKSWKNFAQPCGEPANLAPCHPERRAPLSQSEAALGVEGPLPSPHHANHDENSPILFQQRVAFVMKEILRLHLSIRKRMDGLRSG